MNDFIVRLVPLPSSIRGFTIPDENGDYNIYLNDQLFGDELNDAYDHEVEHIENGDFYDDIRTVQEKEQKTKEGPAFAGP